MTKAHEGFAEMKFYTMECMDDVKLEWVTDIQIDHAKITIQRDNLLEACKSAICELEYVSPCDFVGQTRVESIRLSLKSAIQDAESAHD